MSQYINKDSLFHIPLVNVNDLFQIQTLPMDFEWQSGDTDDFGRPVEIRHERPDHQYVSRAIIESAMIRVGIGERASTRWLTDDEVDWVNENETDWVVQFADEEWQQDNNPEY